MSYSTQSSLGLKDPHNGVITVESGTTFDGSIIPKTTNTYDIGSSSLLWKDLYLSNKLTVGDSNTYLSKNTTTEDVTFQLSPSDFILYNDSLATTTWRSGGVDNLSLTSTTMSSLTHLPRSSNTQDLGSTSFYWKNGYFDGILYSDSFQPKTTNGTVDLNGIKFTQKGTYSSFIGASSSGGSLSTASSCTAHGRNALNSVTTSPNNSAMGREVFWLLDTGAGGNIGMGNYAGNSLITAQYCSLLGYQSDCSSTNANERTGLGYNVTVLNDYDVQLGQSGTATTTGSLIYREQDICKEAWKSVGQQRQLWLDSNGNFSNVCPSVGSASQLTSPTTAVTINNVVGRITTQSFSTAAESTTTFTVTNSQIASVDAITASIVSYAGTYGTNGLPSVNINNIIDDTSFDITVINNHSTNALSGVLKINFKITKQ